MMNCLLCNRPLYWQPSIKQIISFGPLTMPVICQHCQASFECYQPPFCPGCGRSSRNGLCKECQMWQGQYGWLVHNHCLFHYNDTMKDFMHQYKFVGDYQLKKVFCDVMQAWIKQQQFDYLIPIPVTKETMLTRGFNQTVGLIGDFDAHFLLTKAAHKDIPQSAKSREERLKTAQPFMLKEPGRFKQGRILLVDDIYTTGRTLYHAAALFKSAGALTVHSLTLSG